MAEPRLCFSREDMQENSCEAFRCECMKEENFFENFWKDTPCDNCNNWKYDDMICQPEIATNFINFYSKSQRIDTLDEFDDAFSANATSNNNENDELKNDNSDCETVRSDRCSDNDGKSDDIENESVTEPDRPDSSRNVSDSDSNDSQSIEDDSHSDNDANHQHIQGNEVLEQRRLTDEEQSCFIYNSDATRFTTRFSRIFPKSNRSTGFKRRTLNCISNNPLYYETFDGQDFGFSGRKLLVITTYKFPRFTLTEIDEVVAIWENDFQVGKFIVPCMGKWEHIGILPDQFSDEQDYGKYMSFKNLYLKWVSCSRSIEQWFGRYGFTSLERILLSGKWKRKRKLTEW